MTSKHRRLWAFGAVCVCAVVLVVAYVTVVLARRSAASARPAGVARLDAPPAPPYLVVSSTVPDETWRRLILLPADDPRAGAYVTPLSCERSHMAGGRGVCLRQDVSTAAYYLEIFDDQFVPRHRVPLTGVPSRTRVSPNGRWAAATVFEQGHSYAEDGFSTRTTIVDTNTGQTYADLEQFTVERDGRTTIASDRLIRTVMGTCH